MKKQLIVLILMVLIAYPAVSAHATIENSAHDFSAKGWNTSGEICVTCHTPHNAKTEDNAPLWNHAVTTATFIPYTNNGGSLDATVGMPDGVSKLCLSCHDGTLGIDAFGDTTPGTDTLVQGDAGYIGTDLSNDHPVSFTYDETLVSNDGGLNDTTELSGITTTGTIADDMLFGGKVECASCHDVHNEANLAKLLVKSNTGSTLCLTCHDK